MQTNKENKKKLIFLIKFKQCKYRNYKACVNVNKELSMNGLDMLFKCNAKHQFYIIYLITLFHG